MQIIAPDYYKKFKCIADECKHSCCIGWEIDIDSETLDLYKNIKGEWGEKFKKSISYNGTPHFIADEKGRCPFLNQNGLCDIITELGGEDSLCQICYDHPRFYNCFSDREEIGLGLCCEAAASIILNNKNGINLIVLENYGENAPLVEEEKVFNKRNELFNLFQNKQITLAEIADELCKEYNVNPFSASLSDMVNKYRALERLDNIWDDFLNKIEQKNSKSDYVFKVAEDKISLAAKNLLCYFTYRYFATEALNNNERAVINFILESTFICIAATLFYYGDLSNEKLCEVCRIFSAEIEYSEENVAFLLK